MRKALAYFEVHKEQFLGNLMELCAVPSVSVEPPPSADLRRCAELLRTQMERAGLDRTEVLELPDTHPYVYGEWLGAPGAPTLLLYAHHDVQPVGRLEFWKSPPFVPQLRQHDSGLRLYGRGTVDDKAGVHAHLAAVECALKAEGGLPCNVKFIVEGEEEIGSDHLTEFLTRYRDKLQSDVIVLTDTANLDTGIPSLTYRLRGLVQVDVEVRALDHPLHSGMWGGPVPDPVMALCQLLARLQAPDGSIAVPGLYDKVRPLSRAERAALGALPFDEARFREQAGMVHGARIAGEAGPSVYEKLWTRPSLAVSAIEASSIAGASNQIVDVARAKVGLRIVPDQDPVEVQDRLIEFLQADPPWGLEVRLKRNAAARPWVTDPTGPAFDAALRALEAGYGRKPALIGTGATIPFLEPFVQAFGGAPALLFGLEDPLCNAHSENESLHVEDWYGSIRSNLHLYQELAGYRR